VKCESTNAVGLERDASRNVRFHVDADSEIRNGKSVEAIERHELENESLATRRFDGARLIFEFTRRDSHDTFGRARRGDDGRSVKVES